MKTLTPYNITQNEAVMQSRKKTAKYFLNNYQWNENQQWFLNEVADKGYVVTEINAMLEAFGLMLATNGDKVAVMTVDKKLSSGNKPRKKDISIYAF